MDSSCLDFTRCQVGVMETSKLQVHQDQMELTGDYENFEQGQSSVLAMAPGSNGQLVQKVCK